VEEATAKELSQCLEGAIARMSESISFARNHLPHGEFEVFQKSVGLSIGRLSHEVLDPIYAEYPRLAPLGVL
jgi:hypothetical protein